MAVALESPDRIRAAFADAMSTMYRAEVPLYGDLLKIVAAINANALSKDEALRGQLERSGDIARLDTERHGAIRVGTAAELAALARVFAVMGMHPVDYYDLALAGVPVHSTAFRPVTVDALTASPFRLFTSLLRLELIADRELRMRAEALLADRQILSGAAMALTDKAERDGGLSSTDAHQFVAEVLDSFRWHAQARVDLASYRAFAEAHRLIADVVSFRGPHINHLTPRTLDIDAAQTAMNRRAMEAKAVIEGPPPRRIPILLRQTSFNALNETIVFESAELGAQVGTHSARFGEVEQRGAALTPKGRKLYDACLEKARRMQGSTAPDYAQRLALAFTAFPDDAEEMRRQRLAYFRYAVIDADGVIAGGTIDDWVATGRVVAETIVYEDFLPVSAAGIFQSNLGGEEQVSYSAQASRAAFEAALGMPVRDSFGLYAAIEADSLATVKAALGV